MDAQPTQNDINAAREFRSTVIGLSDKSTHQLAMIIAKYCKAERASYQEYKKEIEILTRKLDRLWNGIQVTTGHMSLCDIINKIEADIQHDSPEYLSYNLFLDDERFPSDVTWLEIPKVNWTIVRSYDEFVEVINTYGLPSLISYDHDLGPGKTGFDCAKFIVSQICMELQCEHPKFMVHSQNPIGTDNIIKYVNQYNTEVWNAGAKKSP